MLTKKITVLLDYDLWNKLKALAEERSTSVSELIRQAVIETYFPNFIPNNPNKS